MKMSLRASALSLVFLLSVTLAHAQYPTKPIRFVIPFAPGGASDILARTIALKLGDAVGQTVVIDNRPGGNAVIAEEILAKATPDGHTMLLDTTAFVLNPLFQAKLPFNPERDFAPVIQPASVWHVIATHPGVPGNNVKELIAAMKAAPGKFTYGSFGTGSTAHLAGELFNSAAGVTSTHVPYKGGGPAITDLIGGQISMIYGTVPLAMPHIKSGRVKAIAVTSPKRIAELSNVQTVAEAIPGFEVSLWWAFLVPAGTPKPVIERLNKEIAAVLKMPDVLERLAPQGFDLGGGSPEDLAKFMKVESAKWAKVVKASNIRIE
jgi:tripartite-type tricarboxylate transporter receptor subunit TctC